MRINNLKMTKNKIMSLLLAGGLAFTLTGCSNQAQTAEVTSNSVAYEEIDETEAYEETNEDNIVERNLEDADSAVESAIGIMVEGADELAQASDEAKQTEAYQNEKERVIENFKDLYGFLFEGEEIAGYTADDVKEGTKERAENALVAIDEDLEEIAPNYKERIKDKYNDFKEYLNSDEFKDELADKYNKIKDKWQDIKDYGNDIKERAERIR